eukprot:Nk52_evm39s1569 gene=Nk52_evmTU39s1569
MSRPGMLNRRSSLINAMKVDGLYSTVTIRYELWKDTQIALEANNKKESKKLFAQLMTMERYFGSPGTEEMNDLQNLLNANEHEAEIALEKVRHIVDTFSEKVKEERSNLTTKRTFEVLVVEPESGRGNILRDVSLELEKVSESLLDKAFGYKSVVVSCIEDVIIACLLNDKIQSVVFTGNSVAFSDDLRFHFLNTLQGAQHFVQKVKDDVQKGYHPLVGAVGIVSEIRPELDIFLVTDEVVDDIHPKLWESVDRVFSTRDDKGELHLSIVEGVKKRFNTPFFSALTSYAKRPIGVFHALAISRGNSVLKSSWIDDFVKFYGRNLFQAESSSTCGGLDSLLDPHGALKSAQELAAESFGADKTFFVTNGTSTANKIILQALLRPGDIVLIDRDCHKSHHYGMVLSGAKPCYVDAYPLHDFAMYGGVPLRSLKKALLEYKKAGTLHKVKVVVLTNCTFDGIVYNVQRLMEECLAIKDDLVFLWDEAWYAYAYFNPVFRPRTAMGAANTLKRKVQSSEYKKAYDEFIKKYGSVDSMSDEDVLNTRLIPPPSSRVRVYAAQSTHKSLTALRQGSMVHVNDVDFRKKVENAFHEAYFTHTSTSPNYQILASLDVGRCQMALEGYELVTGAVNNAMIARKAVGDGYESTPEGYFKFLDISDMVPKEYRTDSNIEKYYDIHPGSFNRIEEAFLSDDEFVLEPTRLTLYTGKTGISGDCFKVNWLMDKYGIQVNKTSINTVLLQTNIGTTFSATEYLLQTLERIVQELKNDSASASEREKVVLGKQIAILTSELPALPNFSSFHSSFKTAECLGEGDMRSAFFLAYDEEAVEYIEEKDAPALIAAGRELVGTTFMIPYPPGFPIVVPGQVISSEILEFLRKLDVKEIHGYDRALGMRVFKHSVLEQMVTKTTASAQPVVNEKEQMLCSKDKVKNEN